MEGMSVASTAWLNAVRQADFTGLLGRHLVSRSIFHSCFGDCWHTAELAFVHSSQMYLGAGDRDSAADERIRAAYAHAMRHQTAGALITRHLEGAMELIVSGANARMNAKKDALFELLSGPDR